MERVARKPIRRVAALDSLLVAIDRRSSTPLAVQLCDALRAAVSNGTLAPRTRLPSVRVLAASLSVSRNTVNDALGRLVEEGYLRTSARSGTFVATEIPAMDARPTAIERAAVGQAPGPLRPRAFRLSRPALDLFPVAEWGRVLARRAAGVSVAQLDYDHESVELKSAIADLVGAARGARVAAEQVLLFPGSQRALEFAAACLLRPSDAAWMENPGYPGARRVLHAAGAAIVDVSVDAEGLVVTEGRRLAPHARLAYVTPSCQFPTGSTMSLARRRDLLAWASRSGACVIEDDYDAEFRRDGDALPSLFGLAGAAHVLHLGSFSRTMFPSIRVGFLIAPPPLVDRLSAARTAHEEQLPAFLQLALADFIVEGHYVRHLRRMRVAYRARRDAVKVAAARVGLRLRPDASGLHVIVELPPRADATEVAAAALRRGVEVVPLAQFCAARMSKRVPPVEGAASSLVLGFGAVEPELATTAMQALSAAIADAARARRPGGRR